MNKVRIAGIIPESIVDGPGIRMTIFTQGCIHHCKGCHNPETHPLNGGKFVNIYDILDDIKSNPLLDGVTFSGGEPFLQSKELSLLGKEIKALGLDIITYTGYTFEEIVTGIDKHKYWKELLNITDILIDGKYKEDSRSLLLKFRGSKNQRIIDVKKSLKTNMLKIVEF